MHQTAIAKIEAGGRPIRVNELAALAVLFDVSIASIVEPEPSAPKDRHLNDGHLANLRRRYEGAQRRMVAAERRYLEAVAARERAINGALAARAEFDDARMVLENVSTELVRAISALEEREGLKSSGEHKETP